MVYINNFKHLKLNAEVIFPFLSLFFLFFSTNKLHAQRMLFDVPDSATLSKKDIPVIKTGNSIISISGYLQPQFQATQEAGAGEFQGGAFQGTATNRFRLRRGRIRFDYLFHDKNNRPSTYFVFQFDGNEQGVNIRDFWGRYYENKWNVLSVTAGLFARPFGNELQLSSSSREAPERGRMSQILMKGERDLGAKITFNPRSEDNRLDFLEVDLGLFNGQGLTGPAEFDSKKDLVARISIKPQKVKSLGNISIEGGISLLTGGLVNNADQLFSMQNYNGIWKMQSAGSNNKGKLAKRIYKGADVEISTASKNWQTQVRAEYIFGTQSATRLSSQTPGSYPVLSNLPQPLYERPFRGGYLSFIQNLKNANNQLVLKYDWYDPNTKVRKESILPENGLTAADIAYYTFGFGYLRKINKHLKIVFWYDWIKNEPSGIPLFERDVRDNVFTLRTQFSF